MTRRLPRGPDENDEPLAQILVSPYEGGAPGWRDAALCAQTDPESFFPEKGGSVRAPKRVCRACEVRAECLEYALETDQRYGIWGGMSERERRRLKRAPAAASSNPQPRKAVA